MGRWGQGCDTCDCTPSVCVCLLVDATRREPHFLRAICHFGRSTHSEMAVTTWFEGWAKGFACDGWGQAKELHERPYNGRSVSGLVSSQADVAHRLGWARRCNPGVAESSADLKASTQPWLDIGKTCFHCAHVYRFLHAVFITQQRVQRSFIPLTFSFFHDVEECYYAAILRNLELKRLASSHHVFIALTLSPITHPFAFV